jgi:hypothetical protein
VASLAGQSSDKEKGLVPRPLENKRAIRIRIPLHLLEETPEAQVIPLINLQHPEEYDIILT